MTIEQAIQLCKYYKGEDKCPFNPEEKDACFWWHGEQMFCDNLKRDPDFYQRCHDMAMLDPNDWPAPLNDPNIEEPKRVLMSYLELLHSKWLPYAGWWSILNY